MMKGFSFKIPQSFRELHHKVASVLFIFLCISAITGVSFKWSLQVFGYEEESVKWLMTIHQGSYIQGSTVFYTGFVGTGFLLLIMTGLFVHPFFKSLFLTQKLDRVQNKELH